MTPHWNVDIRHERRLAIYTPLVDRPKYNLVKNVECFCRVHGCFQCNDGDEDINPYFVIELESGQCTYAAPEELRFVDKEEFPDKEMIKHVNGSD